MKLIAWQDIWITMSELEKLSERKTADVLLKAFLDCAAFDDRGACLQEKEPLRISPRSL